MLLETKIPVLYLMGKIKPELIIVTVYASGIVFMHDYVHIQNMSIPMAIPGLLGTAISLILGFRIAQSYDRWWEARKIWGEIVNDSRTLIRQIQTFVVDENNPEDIRQMQKDFAMTQIAFSYSLGKALRGLDPLGGIEQSLNLTEVKELEKSKNIPNAILSLHAKRLKIAVSENWVSGFETIQIDNTITRLTAAMGKAERIKNTVFPTTYTVIVQFLLYLFVMLLPLGMTDYFGYLVAPLMLLISIPFFLLEKTAIHLQNPFNNNKTDIPVISIAQTIELNLEQMIGNDYVCEEVSKEGWYYEM